MGYAVRRGRMKGTEGKKKFEKGKGNVQDELRGSEWLTQLARALHHSIAQSATAHHSDVNGREVCGDRPYRPSSSPFKSPKYFPILAKRQHLTRCMDIYMRRVHVKAIHFLFFAIPIPSAKCSIRETATRHFRLPTTSGPKASNIDGPCTSEHPLVFLQYMYYFVY